MTKEEELQILKDLQTLYKSLKKVCEEKSTKTIDNNKDFKNTTNRIVNFFIEWNKGFGIYKEYSLLSNKFLFPFSIIDKESLINIRAVIQIFLDLKLSINKKIGYIHLCIDTIIQHYDEINQRITQKTQDKKIEELEKTINEYENIVEDYEKIVDDDLETIKQKDKQINKLLYLAISLMMTISEKDNKIAELEKRKKNIDEIKQNIQYLFTTEYLQSRYLDNLLNEILINDKLSQRKKAKYLYCLFNDSDKLNNKFKYKITWKNFYETMCNSLNLETSGYNKESIIKKASTKIDYKRYNLKQ
ncbi:MAG: hypothetical protein SPL06_02555 [Bacteroidales bacterium]|nr:hypothetical protein [Bacteroidales bacterium]MDY6423622.1 hypothetical protein [Bacteroidales bacterium]